jgi:hypothetical protein
MIRLKEYLFYGWFIQSVHEGKVDPQLVFFSDEALFSLRGEVNFLNNQYWRAENSGLIRELPLNDKRMAFGVR